MNYQYLNDKELINDIYEGNSNAFKYVFDLYYVHLCRYVTNFTSDPDVAEDIVQSCYVSLWKQRKKIIFTSSLKSYLYKSCYNGYIDFYRKNKTISEHLEKLRYIEVQRFQTDLEFNSENLSLKKKKLEKAIDNLPEKCRQIFILNKYEGLQYKEIAEDLNISVKTVENQIGIALKRLREELQD
jgi:RNA polymerase sigma-70 factor (ECF subfamily)